MTTTEKIVGNTANFVDERLGAAKWVKKSLNKVFPDHWSFMFGEVCMYSFVILLLSGTFLTFWFDPSQKEVIYNGVYEPLQGLEMSAAYASTLNISFGMSYGSLDFPCFNCLSTSFTSSVVHAGVLFSLAFASLS